MTTENSFVGLADDFGLIPPAVKPLVKGVTSIQMSLFFRANQSFLGEVAERKKEALEQVYSAILGKPVEIVAVQTEPERCVCGCKLSDC